MKKKYILIVDDDPEILSVMTQTLQLNPGYEIIGVGTGKEVLDYVESEQPVPDLFILDFWLPDIDGDDLTIQLRKKPSTKKVPVLLISAVIDAKTIAEVVGADDYLSKPFQIEELEYKVNRIVNSNNIRP